MPATPPWILEQGLLARWARLGSLSAPPARGLSGRPWAGTTRPSVMTYDQATIRLYVNGQQQATFAYTGAITTPNIPVMIGRRGTTGAESWFSGTIDEVAIYNRALTATEVQAHYDAR